MIICKCIRCTIKALSIRKAIPVREGGRGRGRYRSRGLAVYIIINIVLNLRLDTYLQ
jgi:hypothetical protein